MRQRALRTVLAFSTCLILSGCNELGMCTKDSESSLESPQGGYSAEIVDADCVGTSPAKWVVLHGLTKGGSKVVAMFDAQAGGEETEVTLKWSSESEIVIRTNGAKVWSFQPDWHGVHVLKR